MSVVVSVKHAEGCNHRACASDGAPIASGEHTYEITFGRCGHTTILYAPGLPPDVGTTFPCFQCKGYRMHFKVPVKETPP
jgi:hypothetical protein